MPPRKSAEGVGPYATRQRYRSSSAWPPGDDAQLLRARAKRMTWTAIAETYFPGKGYNACRKHYERLVKRQNNEAWDQEKLQAFAAEYWLKRKDIWSPLADAVDQKWQFVEEKCFAIGLARLKSATEANKRPHRVSGMEEDFSDEADSGIVLKDETEMEAGRRHTTGPSSAAARSGRNDSSSHEYDQLQAHQYIAPMSSQQSPQYGYERGSSRSDEYSASKPQAASSDPRALPRPSSSRRSSQRHSIASILSPVPEP